jgi:DNA invertase Pin-like site-specific DNA recombinase
MFLGQAGLKAKDFLPQKVTPQMKQLRCALYARVSTDDKGQDPLNQLLQLREFATRQGWEIVKEYTDEASAKNGERKGFKALFADAAKHRFDVLLFWSLDRLTREGTFKTHCYLKQLTDSGVKFKSFTEQYVDSLGVFGDAIIGLLAALAQQERIRISERTKAGIERNRAKGKTWKRGPNRKYKTGEPSRTTLWRRAKKEDYAAAK